MKTLVTFIIALAAVLPAAANVNAKIQQLSLEKNRLVADTQRLVAKHRLDDNAEYQQVRSDATTAAKNYTTAQRNHPKLIILAKQSDAAKQRMMKARGNGAQKAARDEFSIVRRNLEAASSEIPEIVELRQKSQAAQELVRAKRKALIATLPEGQALLEKIAALDQQIAALQE